MQGLDRIKEKILSDAVSDAETIRARAQERCGEIMFEASRSAEKLKADLDDRAARDAEAIIAAAKSSAAMKKRDILLDAENRAVDRAFSAAYKEVLRLPEADYCRFCAKLVANAFLSELENEKRNTELYGEDGVELADSFELIFNPLDREKYSSKVMCEVERLTVGKLAREELARLRISDSTAQIDGGVIMSFGDTRCNCSLEAVFSEARSRLEGKVAEVLFADIKK